MNKKFQKNRRNKRAKWPRLVLGETAIISKTGGLLEFAQINALKKILKKHIRRVAFKKYPQKICAWVFLVKNHTLSKKSKNSRMGKGKGTNYR